MAYLARAEKVEEAGGTEDEGAILSALRERYRIADNASGDWRKEAIELFDLEAGRQWDEWDLDVMRRLQRPALSFNLMGKYIDAVSGLQIANRMDIRYIARELGDVQLNEMLTSAADWARDRCSAYAEETAAWREMIISGMGWVEQFVDTDDDPEGMLRIRRRDPMEMWHDPMARQQNLQDARYVIRVRYAGKDEVEERWPDRSMAVRNSMGIEPVDSYGYEGYIHNATEAWRYDGSPIGSSEVYATPVIDYQWYERETMYRVFSPMGTRDFTPRQWAKLKIVLEKERVPHRVYPFKGRKYLRAIIMGNEVLESGENPYQEGFTFQAMTGKRDRNRNAWFGIGRALAEPQRFVNKILSEAVYILSTQAKGGLMAERDAFENPAEAEENWARPDSIVWMEPGAMQNRKVEPKPQSPIPAGFDKFLAFSMQALPETSGLNLEILGMANKVQPGVVEAQRKQSAMTMLQWAFDALKLYYEQSGKQTAAYIRDYLADGRLVRVTGKQGDEQYLPLLKDKLTVDYDVIVDQSPTSANQKEQTFAIMMELLPIMQAQGQPIPAEFWLHSPLPSEMAQKLAQSATPDPEAVAKQQQMQEQAAQLEMADKQAGIQEKQAKAQAAQAKVQLDAEKNQIEKQKLSLELEATKADIQSKRARALRDEAEAEAQQIENTFFRHGQAMPGKEVAHG